MAAPKYLKYASGKITQDTSATTGNEVIVSTNSSGKLDAGIMPDGFGAETQSIVASGTLAEGDFVNIFSDSGTLKARRADASNNRPAMGCVLAGYSDGATAIVYVGETTVTGYSSLTVGGEVWLNTSGRATQTAPTSGTAQSLGFALSASTIQQQIKEHIVLS